MLEGRILYNWKEAVVTPDRTLMDALGIIDKEAMRIALVVNDKGELLGTLTDGDVRRALLDHGNLQVPVKNVMNKQPIKASQGMSAIELDTLMQSKSILAIPIVDDNNRLVGLHTLHGSQKGKILENPVFIMAGGFGSRLRPLTDHCPKPMLKVGGKPILETILESFLAAGFRNFFFSTHYLPEVIHNYFGDGTDFDCNITYIHEEQPLGTGGALGLLPDDLPDLPVIMMNGDILTKVDYGALLEHFDQQKAIASMCVRQYQYQVPFGVIKSIDHFVVDVVEKPSHSFFVNAGIYIFSREMLKYVDENHKIDMPTLLMDRVKQGQKVSIFPIMEHWQDIGVPEELKEAEKNYEALFGSGSGAGRSSEKF